MLKNTLRNLRRRLFPPPNPLKDVTFPLAMSRRLGSQEANFEVTGIEDYYRVSLLCDEEEYWQMIVADLRPEDCFWDIGSFTGLLTVYAAQKCSAGRVVSVEPDPGFAERVRLHVKLNQLERVTILNLGLAEQAGVLRLNSSGVDGWAPSFYSKGLNDWIEVPVHTLDELCRQQPDLHPTALKIDVEGFEGQVLQGAAHTLADPRLRVVYLELHPRLLYENRQPVGPMLTRLEEAGLRLQTFSARRDEVHIVARRDGA